MLSISQHSWGGPKTLLLWVHFAAPAYKIPALLRCTLLVKLFKLSTAQLLQLLGLVFGEEAALWALLAGESVELLFFSPKMLDFAVSCPVREEGCG